jgi:hypothetical protein
MSYRMERRRWADKNTKDLKFSDQWAVFLWAIWAISFGKPCWNFT